MLSRLIGENIELQTITGKSPASVKIDPGQFQQILMNLVVNARDAMPGGGKIVIETGNVDLDEDYCVLHPYVTPGRFVMLSVSDTGQGMSKEVKAHIFEPFFTTKERGSGTGLGLATTYGAVKQSGGSIEVYSEVGAGTTFKIYLPRVEEEANTAVNDTRPPDLPEGTETILLVEDEDTVRALGFRILGELGYRVMQARNGEAAIALAARRGERIDLLLTDVVMPGMSGGELAKRMVLHRPEMKVLFTSGHTDDAIVHQGVLDEGVLFLGKPFSPEGLARKVREVLDSDFVERLGGDSGGPQPGEAGLEPEFGIFPAGGDIVDEERHDEEDHGARGDGHQDVKIAEVMDLLPADHGDQGGRAAGRVQGPGRVHDGDGGRHGHSRGQPHPRVEELADGHADEGGNAVPSHEIDGLGQRTLYRSEDQDGGGPEGSDDEEEVRPRQKVVVQERHRSDPREASHPRPEDLPGGDPGGAPGAPFHFPEIIYEHVPPLKVAFTMSFRVRNPRSRPS